MAGETSLPTLLRHMSPVLNDGDYVFCCLRDAHLLAELQPLGSFREREGLSLILPRQQADQAGLSYDYRAAWITLEVHSSLAAVGLTAAVSAALAEQNISCNVVAGYYHDHLFVAQADAQRAMAALRQLAQQAE
ncbi:ACT domain-containing protein [Pseudomonas benzenivorans]|uniref:ACT domain-containing protein n=1 Tax=Pseudomonas benzenivorans TaxID=556533 RepID=A0ABY5H3H1_9PSED|nr:ACT domain-containing protein [Pseudomonas benzenivorans]UTW06852.1 ACT domain-containing protein [Pseudomonas benzenivorans]